MRQQWDETRKFEVAVSYRNALGTHHANFVVDAFDSHDACLKAGMALNDSKFSFMVVENAIVLGVRTEEKN